RTPPIEGDARATRPVGIAVITVHVAQEGGCVDVDPHGCPRAVSVGPTQLRVVGVHGDLTGGDPGLLRTGPPGGPCTGGLEPTAVVDIAPGVVGPGLVVEQGGGSGVDVAAAGREDLGQSVVLDLDGEVVQVG